MSNVQHVLYLATVLYSSCLLPRICVSQTLCDEAYECVFTSIATTSDIHCRGDNSCRLTSLHTSSGGEIFCTAAFACYNSPSLRITEGGTFDSIDCYGLYSCAFVENIYIESGGYNAECNGELSCLGSIINLESSNTLYCHGARSCKDTTVYSKQNNRLGAYLAAENATFYSQDSSVSYYFRGVSSGNNAEVVCGTGHTCTIYCISNACNNLTLTCNNCSDFRIHCYGEASDVCREDTPYTMATWRAYEMISPIYQLPDISDVVLSTYDNSLFACFGDTTDSINCGDYQDAACYNLTLNSSNIINDAPICCTGEESCPDTSITSAISNYSDFTEAIAIRCDGMYAILQ